MRKTVILAALGLALSIATGAQAADEKNKQQTKMATCNKDAGDKKGDERKKFMSDCLKADKKMTQQDKMKACNVDAKDKKGDERKKFMSECLKTKA
ncbi:PsiF family protein [Ramlibacter sp.]|uniref:PsiF family protein n=1 Tax=Ramlibacter sp. TaxID=1917967 RepID=UPI003D0D2BB4